MVPNEAGPYNAMGVVDGQLVNGPIPVGRMLGLPCFVTTAIPTNLGAGANADEIVVLSLMDLFLWESAPVVQALPQTLGNQLSLLIRCYSYGAFMAGRLPGAIAAISGSGLTPPVFQ